MSANFGSLIDHCAFQYLDRCYLTDPDSKLSLTYAELQHRCRQLGQYFADTGVGLNDKVGFLMENGYWTTVIMLGTMYSSRVSVPLNPLTSRHNLKHAIKNSGVKVIFVGAEYQSLLRDLLDEIEYSVRAIDVDMQEGFELPVSIQNSASSLAGKNLNARSTAMILYTSGTTGLPKGAVLTHANLIAGGKNVQRAHGLKAADIAYCVLPLFHINGQVVTTIAQLISGSSVVMPQRFSVRKFWKHIAEYRCTWTSIVPTIAKYLLEAASLAEFDVAKIKQMRFARSASSAMPAGMMLDFEKIFQMLMIETMGLTEAAAPILSNPMPPMPRKSGSVGIPYGNEVAIMDHEENYLPVQAVGEIVVRGENVIKEYYNDPKATQSSFTRSGGWFKTGDLGYEDKDGYFYVTGRIKELVIKGGENISPREIDDVLYHHPAVLEAAAFGVPDESYGETVAVAIVLKKDKEHQAVTERDLTLFCQQELGKFRTPSYVYFLNDLPKGPSGKIQRLEIAKSFQSSPA